MQFFAPAFNLQQFYENDETFVFNQLNNKVIKTLSRINNPATVNHAAFIHLFLTFNHESELSVCSAMRAHTIVFSCFSYKTSRIRKFYFAF